VYPVPALLAFRRNRNLCDVLVHTKTNKSLVCTPECDCYICRIISREAVSNTAGIKSHSVLPDVNCETRNVVYVLLCLRCQCTVYVGETERAIKERTNEYTDPAGHFANHTEDDLLVGILNKSTANGT
jgi:hypothetical protein